MLGELKKPLLNKKIIIPIIGPIPKINKISLAEFFVWPNLLLLLFFIIDFWFFFDDFFFMGIILQQTNSDIKKFFLFLKNYYQYDISRRKYKNSILYSELLW